MTKESNTNEINRVEIDEDFYIHSDSNQLLLQRKSIAQKGEKKGEVVFYTESYHGTLESLLNNYVNIKTRESTKNCSTVKELISEIKSLKEHIKTITM